MRARIWARLTAVVGATALVAGMVAIIGTATPAVAQAASCSFTPSGGGSGGGTGPTLISGVVAGSTSVNISCSGLGPGTFIAVMASSLGGVIVSPGSAANIADLTTLTVLSPSGTGTVAVPATFSAKDPNATCPPSQAQINAGLVGCAIAVANFNTQSAVPNADVILTYVGQGSPAAPTLAVSPTTAAPGQTVSVSDAQGATSFWWGNATAATKIPSSSITVGGSPVAASSVNVSAATYNGTTLTPPSLSGSFVVPCSAIGSVPVTITEANQALIPGTVTATAQLTVSTSGALTPCVSSLSPDRGPKTGGTQVAISGTLLSGATAVDFGTTPAQSFTVNSDTSITAVSPPGTGPVVVTVTSPKGTSSPAPSLANTFTYGLDGYNLAGMDGGVFNFGDATYHGSLPAYGIKPRLIVSGITTTADGGGYWMTDALGGVYAFGDGPWLGSLPALRVTPAAPVMGIAATPDNGGYWLVSADGGVYAFGDAQFLGSLPGDGVHPNGPIQGIEATPDGGGYWLVGSDGGVYAYGDAGFFGSMGGTRLSQPVVGMSAPDGGGYVLVGADGGVFAFGDAQYQGSLPGLHVTPSKPIVGIASFDPTGYWEFGADGGVFAFGDAQFLGSAASLNLSSPIRGTSIG